MDLPEAEIYTITFGLIFGSGLLSILWATGFQFHTSFWLFLGMVVIGPGTAMAALIVHVAFSHRQPDNESSSPDA